MLLEEQLSKLGLPPILLNDMVNRPKHYVGMQGLEVEEVLKNYLPKIDDGYVSHRVGSAIEYILRHSEKNGVEDLKKARRNLDQIITYLEQQFEEEEK